MYVLFNLFHTGNNNGNCIGNCKGVIAGNGNGNDNHSDKPSGNNNGNCIGKESMAYKHIYHCCRMCYVCLRFISSDFPNEALQVLVV